MIRDKVVSLSSEFTCSPLVCVCVCVCFGGGGCFCCYEMT